MKINRLLMVLPLLGLVACGSSTSATPTTSTPTSSTTAAVSSASPSGSAVVSSSAPTSAGSSSAGSPSAAASSSGVAPSGAPASGATAAPVSAGWATSAPASAPPTSTGPVTDADHNSYDTVVIGAQRWMKQNLRTTTCSDGTAIPQVADGKAWTVRNAPAYTYSTQAFAGLTDAEKDKRIGDYGALYNYYAATAACNICPTGFRVPTQSDFQTLLTTVGAGAEAKLREAAYWTTPGDATNASGFSARAAGGQNGVDVGSYDFGTQAYFWSTTARDAHAGYLMVIHGADAGFGGVADPTFGFSVRCLSGAVPDQAGSAANPFVTAALTPAPATTTPATTTSAASTTTVAGLSPDTATPTSTTTSSTTSAAADPGCTAFKDAALAEINKEREEATKIDGIVRPPMQWNGQLACQTEEWAKAHADGSYTSNKHCCAAYGHSLSSTWPVGAAEGMAFGPTDITAGIRLWRDSEMKNYDFTAPEAAKRKDHTCSAQICGHYGAVISLFWNQVGCGFAPDPAGKASNWRNWTTVCQYK